MPKTTYVATAPNGAIFTRKVYNEAQRAEVERHNAERLAEAKATVKTYGTAAAYAEAKKNERVARLVAKLVDGGFDEWFVEGFCGRFDLAQKLAGKVNGGYFAMNATIVPATIFAK